MTATATHCPYCSLQCGMDIAADLTITPRATDASPGLCQKGFTAAALLDPEVRLTTPLVRRDGKLVPAGWAEALATVTSGISAVQERHGRDAVGIFGGGGLTNEQCYLLGKLARVALRTRTIDYNGRFCMSSGAAAGNRAFGLDRGLPFPLSDLGQTDVLMLVGANPIDTMPPAVAHLERLLERGGELLVADPRRTPTAALATLHLQNVPGSDLALALGLLHLAIADRHIDEEYVATRTTGWDEVRPLVAAWWPERVERTTGVPVARLRRAAGLLGEASSAIIVTGRGAEQQSKGTDTATAYLNLALALGLPGRPLSGWGCLTGQGNGQGGREHGQKADQLPGYRSISDEASRAHVADVWGVDPASIPGPGPSAYEMLTQLGESVHALLVMGSNLAVCAPDADRIRERLSALELLVVADVVRSETAELADVVLPVAMWAEEDGTMTTVEGRVVRRRKACEPPAEVRTDLEVISAIAAGAGATSGFPTEAEAVFAELRRASAGGVADYSGISYARIDAEGGVFWPCPADDHPGTPRVFTDRFATPDGLARFVPVEHRPAAEEPDADYPLYLTTGRTRGHYQSGAQTRRVRALADAEPAAFVEVHPTLAAAVGLADGGRARLVTRRGAAELDVRIDPAIQAETVFVPFHWGEANRLTNPALDPTSRMPELKVCAARLEAVAS
ncbi:MAG TPA: molybdopterin oxidoreductase family protein [Mycobacteriales bacterium]|nr:molybdopterin oxidoreductase family protein [Mycobacteriales bacterium]